MDETPEEAKLRCAVFHLEGDEIQWNRAFMRTRNATISDVWWEDYVLAITTRFSNAMFEDPLEKIASLNQTDSVLELNTAFDSLLNKVTLSETQAVSLYLKDLKLDIRGPVKMFKPRTLHEAYGLAKTQALIMKIGRKFVSGYKCARNQNQLYIIEMDDEYDIGVVETLDEEEEKDH
ncbi:uncharacterized protein LOC143583178 [Bidens hawaiensis]|uniref:uncharacterized protein LOC143583178 n=1 Tax=Bidens hawaiensis TaxID=980011 RepID=UPI00404A75A9